MHFRTVNVQESIAWPPPNVGTNQVTPVARGKTVEGHKEGKQVGEGEG